MDKETKISLLEAEVSKCKELLNKVISNGAPWYTHHLEDSNRNLREEIEREKRIPWYRRLNKW